MAQCCTPKVGDKVVGYATRDGVNIHRSDCEFLQTANIGRLIPAYWEGQEQTGLIIKLELLFSDRIGILKDLADILFRMELNVDDIRTQKTPQNEVSIHLSLASGDEDYYIADRLLEHVGEKIKEFKKGKIIEIK